jgi:RNA-directed DNA polymerase
LRQVTDSLNEIAIRHPQGVHVQAAVACGITSKGPWRSSKTPGINQALSNAYLKYQGLYQLRDGWIKLHYSQ